MDEGLTHSCVAESLNLGILPHTMPDNQVSLTRLELFFPSKVIAIYMTGSECLDP